MMYCNGTTVNGPKVGDRLMRKPELGHDNIPDPIPCTVYMSTRPTATIPYNSTPATGSPTNSEVDP